MVFNSDHARQFQFAFWSHQRWILQYTYTVTGVYSTSYLFIDEA